jgi:hypothetical protein
MQGKFLGVHSNEAISTKYLNQVAHVSSCVLGEYCETETMMMGYLAGIQFHISALFRKGLFFEQNEAESKIWIHLAEQKKYIIGRSLKLMMWLKILYYLMKINLDNLGDGLLVQTLPFLIHKNFD